MPKCVLQADKFYAEFGGDGCVRERIMSDEAHVERFRQTKQFGPDIADAEGTERAPDQADAHVVRTFGEACRALACQPILHHELAGQREHQRDDGNRDRAAHPIGRDRHRDPRAGASVEVDRVVSDAEARDDREPRTRGNALCGETMREQYERVEILELVAAQRIGGFEKGDLDVLRRAQRPKIEIRVSRRAVSLAKVAGQSDAKHLGHRTSSASLGRPLAGA